MPAFGNAYGVDFGAIAQTGNALMAGRQEQQLNALAIKKGQRDQDVQNAFATNAPALYGDDPAAQKNALQSVAQAGASPDTIIQFQQHLESLGDTQRKSLRDGFELGGQLAGSVIDTPDDQLADAVLSKVVPVAGAAKLPFTTPLGQAAAIAKQTGDTTQLKTMLKSVQTLGLTGTQQIDQFDKTRESNRKDANSAFKADGTPNPGYQSYEQSLRAVAPTINIGAREAASDNQGWQFMTDPTNGKQFRANARTGQTVDLSGAPYTPGGVAKLPGGASSTSAPLSPDQAKFFADQVLAGDKSPFTGLGRNKEALSQLRDAVATEAAARGLKGSDLAAINAQFAGSLQEERTVGQRAGAIAVSSQEAKGVAGLVNDAYAKLPRTEFKPFNQLASLYADQTNSPEQGAAYMADFSLVTAYARALNPQGVPREADIGIATKMLNGADSIEKHTAVVNQMLKEIDTIQTATGKARIDTINRIRGQGGLPAASAQPPAQAAPQNGAGNDPLSQARDAIAKGADRNAVIQRLKQNGINPGGL
jgi:hypothetical protein